MNQRNMFGESSNTTTAMVRDGTTNTVAVLEGTLDVQNGRRAPWGYRGWVHLGIDLPSSNTINNWIYASANPPFKAGRLGTWQNAGSQHPLLEEQHLGQATRRLAGPQACSPHAGVVEHHQRAARHQPHPVDQAAVLEPLLAYHQQPRIFAACSRMLRYGLLGQRVVQEIGAHGGPSTATKFAAMMGLFCCPLIPSVRSGARRT